MNSGRLFERDRRKFVRCSDGFCLAPRKGRISQSQFARDLDPLGLVLGTSDSARLGSSAMEIIGVARHWLGFPYFVVFQTYCGAVVIASRRRAVQRAAFSLWRTIIDPELQNWRPFAAFTLAC